MTDLDFSPFEPLTSQNWRALIERDLKGRPFDALRWEVEPGIVLEPFYTHEDVAESVALALPNRPAQVVQYLAAPEVPIAREALSSGAEALFVDAPGPLPTGWPEARTWRAPDLSARLASGEAPAMIDGITLREAGATRVETLAWMAAQASAWFLSRTERRDVRQLDVRVSVGPAFVPEIAFLRALRIVLQNVADAYGETGAECHLLAVTSRYHQTSFAAHTNLLRNTLAAAAALIGGADALCVRPHDLLAGGTANGRRLARQTHLLLRDESHLSRVADPAAGAYAAEHLTRALAEGAWKRFGEIEAAGGLFEAAQTLDLTKVVEQQHRQRQDEILSGRQRIVGLTRSADPSDSAPAVAAEDDRPLAPRRLSAPFEQLRHGVAEKAVHPAALLLFGSPAQRTARANFTRDFLATAGLTAREVEVMDELPAEASAIILCAGDDDYASDGADLVAQVRRRFPAMPIWVAGRPDAEPALRASGASFFLSARAPLFDHLRDALATLDLLD